MRWTSPVLRSRPTPSMTFPDMETSGAVLIARTTGMALGENCISASMYGLGKAAK
jgi:hypothetical protein